MKRILALIIFSLSSIGVILTAIGFGLDNSETMFISAISVLKYFTIQSNILVILYFGLVFFKGLDKSEKFRKFLSPVVSYITLTCVVFLLFLQSVWKPTGLIFFGSVLNHYVTPTLAIAFLIIFRKEYHFQWRHFGYWLIYPLAYLVFAIIMGLTTSDWIYPFFDIPENGVVSFVIFVASLFIFISGILIVDILFTKAKPKDTV